MPDRLSTRAGTNPPQAMTSPPPVQLEPLVVSAPRLDPAPQPAPQAQATLSGVLQPPVQGREMTPCDFGFCGPVARVGVPGQTPTYMSDGGTSAFWGAAPGGRSLLGQMVTAEQFTPGRLGQYIQGQDQAQLVSARNNPTYGSLYSALLAQTGDPAAAQALADAQVGLDNPGLTGAFATYQADAAQASLNEARDRAAAAAAFTGDPTLAARPFVEGTFQPGLAVSGAGPYGTEVAYGGQVAGSITPRADRTEYAELGAAQQGLGSLFGQVGERRASMLEEQRAQLRDQLAAEQAQLRLMQDQRLRDETAIRQAREARQAETAASQTTSPAASGWGLVD